MYSSRSLEPFNLNYELKLKWANVINRLYLPVLDQCKFVTCRRIINIGSDLSQMNIQILRYTRRIRYLYLAEYRSTQVNDGVNLKTITHEVNGELNCKVVPNT